TLAASIFSTLNTWNVNSKIVYVDDIHKNDPISIADINRSNGYIFAGTAIDSVAALLAPSTGIGNAFRGKVSQGRPVLFVGDDVMLAGSQVIIGLTSSMYSAYYGNLTLSPGLDLLHGVIPIGRFYQNLDNSRGYDYSENRIMGLYWTLAKTNSAMGIIIDAGAFVDVFNNKFSAGSVSNNSTPPIIVDFQNGKLIDYPIFHRPGRPNAVQSAALIGAKLHVLRSNESVTVSVKNSDSHQLKKKLVLEQNFPNPFNPSTQFTYTLTQEGLVHVRIFDTLGKEVAILGDSFKKPGSYSVNWNASGFASGIYCVSVTLQQGVNISSSTMKIVLIK
ncbi:MAG: T9SS type A sorting domain-containing protein, partial [Ignavibacteria bacterium]|nr:T9SS type A sorting domain-containing protein [Ignavibacteria bacterium]